MLRPGGVLALVWQIEDRSTHPWIGQWRDLLERYDGAVPQYRKGAWKQVLGEEQVGVWIVGSWG